MKRKHHSQKTINKISNTLKEKYISKELIHQFKGKHHTKDTKNRLSILRQKQVFPIKDTKPEKKIQNFLSRLQIEFFTHQYIHIEHGYQCDIFIPAKKLIIECFGDYWHKYPIGREIDSLRCQELRAIGYKLFVFWEREIRAMELADFKNKLESIN